MCGEEAQLWPRKATKGKEATTEEGRKGREAKIENRGGGDEIASARRGPGRGVRRTIGPRVNAGMGVNHPAVAGDFKPRAGPSHQAKPACAGGTESRHFAVLGKCELEYSQAV